MERAHAASVWLLRAAWRLLWRASRSRLVVSDLRAGQLVMLAFATALAVVVVDLALAHHLTVFFGLCLVLLAVSGALAVRTDDRFTAAVLPPLLLVSVVAVLAAAAPDSLLLTQPAWSERVLSALGDQAWALVSAHLLALATLGWRMRLAAPRRAG